MKTLDVTKERFRFNDSGYGGIECCETHWDIINRLVAHPMWPTVREAHTYSRREMAAFYAQILRLKTTDIDEILEIGKRTMWEVMSLTSPVR